MALENIEIYGETMRCLKEIVDKTVSIILTEQSENRKLILSLLLTQINTQSSQVSVKPLIDNLSGQLDKDIKENFTKQDIVTVDKPKLQTVPLKYPKLNLPKFKYLQTNTQLYDDIYYLSSNINPIILKSVFPIHSIKANTNKIQTINLYNQIKDQKIPETATKRLSAIENSNNKKQKIDDIKHSNSLVNMQVNIFKMKDPIINLSINPQFNYFSAVDQQNHENIRNRNFLSKLDNFSYPQQALKVSICVNNNELNYPIVEEPPESQQREDKVYDYVKEEDIFDANLNNENEKIDLFHYPVYQTQVYEPIIDHTKRFNEDTDQNLQNNSEVVTLEDIVLLNESEKVYEEPSVDDVTQFGTQMFSFREETQGFFYQFNEDDLTSFENSYIYSDTDDQQLELDKEIVEEIESFYSVTQPFNALSNEKLNNLFINDYLEAKATQMVSKLSKTSQTEEKKKILKRKMMMVGLSKRQKLTQHLHAKCSLKLN